MSNRWQKHTDKKDREKILAFYKDSNYRELWPTVTIENPELVTADTKILNTDQWNTLDLSKAKISPQDGIVVTVSGTYANGKPLNFTTNIPLFAERAEIELPSPPESALESQFRKWDEEKVFNARGVLAGMRDWWDLNSVDRTELYKYYCREKNKILWPTVDFVGDRSLVVEERFKPALEKSRVQPPLSASERWSLTYTANWKDPRLAQHNPIEVQTEVFLFTNSVTIRLPSVPDLTISDFIAGWKTRIDEDRAGVLREMGERWNRHLEDREEILKFYRDSKSKNLWPVVTIQNPELAKGDTLQKTLQPSNDGFSLKVTGTYANGADIAIDKTIPLFSDEWPVTIPALDIQRMLEKWKNQCADQNPPRDIILKEMKDWWDGHQGLGDRKPLWDWYRSTDILHPTYTLVLPSEAEAPTFDPPGAAASGRLHPPEAIPSGTTFRVSYQSRWTTTGVSFSDGVDVPIFKSSVEFPTPAAPKPKDLVLRTFRDFDESPKGVSPATVSGTKRIVSRGDAGYRTPADQFSGGTGFREVDGDLSVRLTNRNDFKWIAQGDSVYCGSRRIGTVKNGPSGDLVSVALDRELLKPGEYCDLSDRISVGDREAVESRWNWDVMKGNRSNVLSQMAAMSEGAGRAEWLSSFWKKEENSSLWPEVRVDNPNGFPILVDGRTIAAKGTGRFSVFVPFKGTKTWAPTIVPDAEHEGYESSGGLSVPISWNIGETNVIGPTIEIKPVDVQPESTGIGLDDAKAKELYSEIRSEINRQPYLKGFFGYGRNKKGWRSYVQKIDNSYTNLSTFESLRQYATDHTNVWANTNPFTDEEWGKIETASKAP